MAEKVVVRGNIRKPGEYGEKGMNPQGVITYGIQSPGANFDRRPECGPAPRYVGPSKVEGRSSAIKGGKGQSKKHKSTGKGQR